MFKTRLVLAVMLLSSGTAFASNDKCNAGAKEQWQSIETLEKKLIAEGWKIKKAKVDSGCYEVYGTDAKGQRVEIFFNPKTLEPVKG